MGCTTMCVSQSTRQRQTLGQRQSAAQSTRMIVSISGRGREPPRCGQSFLAPASPTLTTPATTSKSQRAHKCPIKSATKCLHRSASMYQRSSVILLQSRYATRYPTRSVLRYPRLTAGPTTRRCAATTLVLPPQATTTTSLATNFSLNQVVPAPATDHPTTDSPQTILTPSLLSATAMPSNSSKFNLYINLSSTACDTNKYVNRNRKHAAAVNAVSKLRIGC